MAIEIERKFLVLGRAWDADSGTRYRQGYLSTDPTRTVRVRAAGRDGFLTIKGEPTGEARLSRLEFEYPIPLADAEVLLALAVGAVIDKVRRVLDVEGTRWEVDEFLGANAGLVVAEVELPSEDASYARPAWLGAEVSADGRFANAALAQRPFEAWPPAWRKAVADGVAPLGG